MSKGMSGAEIAKVLGCSRQNVSLILKKALSKLYTALRDNGLDPMEAVLSILHFCEVDMSDSDLDYKDFFKLLPNNVKEDIYEHHKGL